MFNLFYALWWAYHPNPLLHQTTVSRSQFDVTRISTAAKELISVDPINATPQEILNYLHDSLIEFSRRNWSERNLRNYFHFNIKSSVDFIFNFTLLNVRRTGHVSSECYLIPIFLNKVIFKIKRNNQDTYVKLQIEGLTDLRHLLISETKFEELYRSSNLIVAETSFEYDSSVFEHFNENYERVF